MDILLLASRVLCDVLVDWREERKSRRCVGVLGGLGFHVVCVCNSVCYVIEESSLT